MWVHVAHLVHWRSTASRSATHHSGILSAVPVVGKVWWEVKVGHDIVGITHKVLLWISHEVVMLLLLWIEVLVPHKVLLLLAKVWIKVLIRWTLIIVLVRSLIIVLVWSLIEPLHWSLIKALIKVVVHRVISLIVVVVVVVVLIATKTILLKVSKVVLMTIEIHVWISSVLHHHLFLHRPGISKSLSDSGIKCVGAHLTGVVHWWSSHGNPGVQLCTCVDL